MTPGDSWYAGENVKFRTYPERVLLTFRDEKPLFRIRDAWFRRFAISLMLLDGSAFMGRLDDLRCIHIHDHRATLNWIPSKNSLAPGNNRYSWPSGVIFHKLFPAHVIALIIIQIRRQRMVSVLYSWSSFFYSDELLKIITQIGNFSHLIFLLRKVKT